MVHPSALTLFFFFSLTTCHLLPFPLFTCIILKLNGVVKGWETLPLVSTDLDEKWKWNPFSDRKWGWNALAGRNTKMGLNENGDGNHKSGRNWWWKIMETIIYSIFSLSKFIPSLNQPALFFLMDSINKRDINGTFKFLQNLQFPLII